MPEINFEVAGSGTTVPFNFDYVSNVSEAKFKSASEALDRALLRAIGLPEDVDVRAFENAVNGIIIKINDLIKNFSFANALWLIPEIIEDGIALYDEMKPVISDKVERTDFISRTIVYAYKKHDPDLPWITEPFESMVEKLILGAVPSLVEKASDGLEPVIQDWIEKLKKFFS